MRAVFREMCPNCGGRITDERLVMGLPCEKCLPSLDGIPKEVLEGEDFLKRLKVIERELKKRGTLKRFKELVEIEERTEDFCNFFKKVLGNRPWTAQRTWARRVLEDKSFTILAPTGVGKTVFGLIMAIYLAKEGKKCYIVLPNTLLLKQVHEKLLSFIERSGVEGLRVVAYHAGLSQKRRKEVIEAITSGDYDILVTTSHFLATKFDVLSDKRFDYIFVDDVDAILKSSKNVDKILQLLGFPEQAITLALRIVILRRRLARYLATGQEVPEELSRELEDSERELEELLEGRRVGCLVISTATGRPRGLRVRLFRELLGFEVGSRAEFMRNVVDSYVITSEVEKEVVRLAKLLGRGGLIFVPAGKGQEYAESLVKALNEAGVKAAFVHSRDKKGLDLFVEGELDVLVGTATYYGLLVRGLDLPHIVRYAIFAGVPHFKFTAEIEEISPARLLQIAGNIRDALPKDVRSKVDRLLVRIRRRLLELDQAKAQLLMDALRKGELLSGPLGRLQQMVLELRGIVKEYLSREDVVRVLEEKTPLVIREIEGKRYFLLPDPMTYLQASGRTSRLYAGGISKGLSVVVIDDEKLFRWLVKQTKWYSEDIEWVEFDKLDLEKLISEIDAERDFIRRLMRGEVKPEEVKDLVRVALLVVESPTKARTIASFFGKPSRRTYAGLDLYEVSMGDYMLLIAASKGHVLDLVTQEGYYGVLVLDSRGFYPIYTTIKRCLNCGEQFTDFQGAEGKCPKCGSDRIYDQRAVIESLRDIAKEVDLVLLGTDPDTEGEKIAWDLEALLRPYVPNVRRIEFHEVTRRAVERAIRNPRDIDCKLVEAQIVRRVEDRWIGFVLSQKLWSKFGFKWLSAGRVQTPVLGWVIERYEEAKKSVRPVFRITLENGFTFVVENAELGELKPRELAERIKEEGVEVYGAEEKEVKLPPPPPYTTDTMLRDATTALRLSADEVMRLAQDLFELGLITYHRTDSTRVSAVGIALAREYISEKYGAEMFKPRTWGAEGAHECIRPTRAIDAETLLNLIRQGVVQLARPLTPRHIRLYDMIFRRFIASQMPPARVKVYSFKVKGPGFEKSLEHYVEVVEPGYTLTLPLRLLDRIPEGRYRVKEVTYRRVATVPLYTQADLVRLMRERGIGRPSTYAKIIKTLLDRKYIIEVGRKRKLVPTKLGIEVYRYLSSNYRSLISEDRTRRVEEEMDMIERGERSYLDTLKEFYEEIRGVEVGKP